ncbi:PadR family transcriptional regulator [Oceanobacillus saliphilus]|uniref:PadR family transcriptional regulator n=1 Tax=Oceanobacillus saliphilus TaxID=2925834 RepID=UPI00201E4719|nr:PadR family transcriptional regulator [Oceanobacillus saliphilus]
MEERLIGLRKSMEKTTFNQWRFLDQHKNKIHEKITKLYESEEDIILAILQLLNLEKNGYELLQLLRARGVREFEGEEGLLYTKLHRLEQDRFIKARWNKFGVKYYQLDGKGKKVLRKIEKDSANKRLILKEWMEV